MTNGTDSTREAPKRRRIWRSFSLRVLMLLVAFVGLWLARETNRARRQQRALEVIWDRGGAIVGNDELNEDGLPYRSKGYNAVQRSLMRVLGEDYIRRPRWVMFDPPGPPYPEQRRLDEKGWVALTELSDLAILFLLYQAAVETQNN